MEEWRGHRFISIHAPREGGDNAWIQDMVRGSISIHAPREGGDFDASDVDLIIFDISIHAPREGGDYWSAGPRWAR